MRQLRRLLAASFAIAVLSSCGGGDSGTQTQTLTIRAASPPTGTTGTVYASYAFIAAGGTPPFTWTERGALPPGVTLSGAGLLSGDPGTAGTYPITITVTDSSMPPLTDSAPVSLQVNDSEIVIAPASPPAGTVTYAYPRFGFSASGGSPPYVWKMNGTLPPGLTLGSDGTVSGTPTQVGMFAFSVTAIDSAQRPMSSPPLATQIMIGRGSRDWVWKSGSNTGAALGVYGTQGMAAPGNVPGARESSVSWSDGAGHLWLFGGSGYDSVGDKALLNDLWRYSPGTGQWTWVSGSNTAGAKGVYGTLGVAASGNVPGARSNSVSWTDGAGNLWLFGGRAIDSKGASTYLNDVWRFSSSSGHWTWVGGSNTVNSTGVYGALNTAAPGNVPGARESSVSWTDSAGNMWLFGGQGYDSAGYLGSLNDLWRYSRTTGQWIWVKGSSTAGAEGVYGTQGISAPGNVPGARFASISWTDSAENLWLFGGLGSDSTGRWGFLNDLWRYSPDTGQWTWVSGSNTLTNAMGVYGSLGVAAPDNVPRGRTASVSWTDSAGDLWLFGGRQGFGFFNDLWRYSVGTGEWTWISGSSTGPVKGMYGTLGIGAAGNVPGARFASISWTDSAGNMWLFGGLGWDSAGPGGDLNDLWMY